MKNTKNLLLTGVALAIALFASVQITAMEVDKPVNPYLSSKQKNNLETAIFITKQAIELFNQGETSPEESERNKRMFHKKMESEEQRIQHINAILYGDRAYTDEEISNLVYPSF